MTKTRMSTDVRRIEVQGAFDLRQSAEFGFGQRSATSFEGVMRLAFCVDGYAEQAGVVVRPDGGSLVCEVTGGDPDAATAQVARVLSVDLDGRGYDDLGRRNPLVGRLQEVRPGLRPPLFHSAYEAVAWSILSARRPQQQGARSRDRLGEQHGRTFELGGVRLAAFPTPHQLLEVTELSGLPTVALTRLHAVAEVARDGGLDTEVLRALPPEEAVAALRRLPGIGPFYAELVVVRALGHTDVLPSQEPRVRELAAELAGESAGKSLDDSAFRALAEAWTPWRTWVAVALRAAGPLLSSHQERARA
jgi:DNA-3-methyladenine glycosylase II